jgi:hypothetical protein
VIVSARDVLQKFASENDRERSQQVVNFGGLQAH